MNVFFDILGKFYANNQGKTTDNKPAIHSVAKDSKTKEHWKEYGEDEQPDPGKVESNLLAKVVSYLPEWLELEDIWPSHIQVIK